MDDLSDNIIIREFNMFIWFVVNCTILIIVGLMEDFICFHIGRGTDLPFWRVLFVIVPLSLIFTYIISRVNAKFNGLQGKGKNNK